jgi:hypothetical protein
MSFMLRLLDKDESDFEPVTLKVIHSFISKVHRRGYVRMAQ